MKKKYSVYYQADAVRERCWFLTAHLRSEDHLAFDRTIDKKQSIFEFFVPEAHVEHFEQVMQDMQDMGVIDAWRKLPNRLAQPGTKL